MALRVDTSVVSASETPAIDNAIQQSAVMVAQAGTDSASAQPLPDRVVEIAEGQILQLPEGTSIDEPRMNGANLEFVQPDGSVVIIPNGAVNGLTIFIGSVEIPPIAVAALFEANGIEAAAGPEASTHRSSGGDFSRPVGDIGDALNYGGLLDDSAYNTLGGAQGPQDYVSNLAPMFALPGFIEAQLSETDLVGNGAPGSAVITLSLNASDPNNDPLTFTFGTPASGLTSNGVTLSWTGVGTDSLTGWAGPDQVITATISGGSVTITLLAPLDHPSAGNDSIVFDLPITASDGQGGSAATFVRVTIGDDSPNLVGADDGRVEESAVLAPAETPASDLKTASGSLGISWGADSGNSQVNAGQTGAFGDRAVVFSSTIESDLLALGLSSGGTALSYALDSTGTNLIASAGTRTIFTVALSDEGSGGYVFTLVGNLDHAAALGQNEVSISFGFTALDADGDSVPGTFKIVIVDDVPVANDVLAGMDENQTLTVTLVEGVDYSAGADGSSISLGQAEIVAGSTTVTGLGLPGIALVGNVVTVTPGTAFDALAKGETVTLRIPYTVTDGDQDAVTREIIVTVTGTNDAPVLFASSGTVRELAGETLSFAARTVSGSMAFTDVDLNDVGHSATITGVTRGGESDGLPSGFLSNAILRSLLSIDTVTKAAGSADGAVKWTFSAPDALFDYLSAGQKATLTYAVRLSDGDGGFSTQNVKVTIVGTNDQPRFLAGDLRFLSEVVDQTDGDTARSASGTLAFVDADRDDAGHQASVESVSASGTTAGLDPSDLLSALTINSVSSAVNQVSGSVSWSFSASDRTFDYLGHGESVTLAYQVKLDDRVLVADGKNLTDTTTIYITIVGTNDRPVIGAGKDAAALTETAQLSSTGTLAFTDVDLTDTHSVSEQLAGAQWSGGTFEDLPQATRDLIGAAFDAQISNHATGDGVGEIKWDFALAGQAVDFLAKGEKLILTYRIALRDDSGASNNIAYKDVTITVTGTNDAPVLDALSVTVTEFVGETLSFAAQTVSGSMAFTDVDLNDVGHSATITGVTRGGESDGLPSGVLGNLYLRSLLSIDTVTKAAGSADGAVNWTFSAPDAMFDYLSAGQTATLTYSVRLSDGDGGFSTKNLTVTIVGTNDQPRFVAGDLRVLSEVLDQTDGDTARSASGTLAFVDADRDDADHDVTVESVSASGTTAGLNPSALLSALTITNVSSAVNQVTGSVSWSFSASDRTFDYLGRGESVTLAYQVKLDDHVAGGQNLTDTTTIYITIVGTNDRPVIGAGKDAAALTETAQLSSTGTLAFTDVDLTDTHSVTEQLADAQWSGGTFEDLPQATRDLIGAAFDAQISNHATGDGVGEIKWDFALAGQAVDFLARGETLTLTYRIALRDDSGASNNIAYKDVTITVTGTNDRPVVESNSTAAFSENTDTTLSLAPNGVSGVVNFTDLDLNDTHTANIIGARAEGVTGALPSNSILQALALAPWISLGDVSRTAAGAETGTVEWTFAAPDMAFDYLGEGETLTLIYTIRVRDNNGGQHQNELRITVTGTNDQPVFANASTVAINEVADQTAVATPMSTNGVLVFADADINDTYTASVISADVTTANGNVPADILNAVTFAIGTPQTTNGAPGGYLSWSFNAVDNTFDFLAQGETLTLTYTVAVKDDSGATNDTATTTVTVTITGTNDAPVITGGLSGSVVESGDIAGIYEAGVGGKLTHDFNLTGAADDALGAIRAGATDSAAFNAAFDAVFAVTGDEAAAFAVLWSYFNAHYNPSFAEQGNDPINAASARLAIAYARYVEAGGAPLVDVIAHFNADGNNNGTPDRMQSLHDNILGNANSGVLLVRFSGDLLSELQAAAPAYLLNRPWVSGNEGAADQSAEDMANGYAPTANGQLMASDVDHGAQLSFSVANGSGGFGTSSVGTYGTLTVNADGSWTYVLNNRDLDTQALAQGQEVNETFTVQVEDEHGATGTDTLTIKVTGTNDAPMITGTSSQPYTASELVGFHEAHEATQHDFEPIHDLGGVIQGALNTNPTDMAAVLTIVQAAISTATGSPASLAQAIAYVWDNLDDNYKADGYYNTSVNALAIRLGVEYAAYLKAGNAPLLDVVAKYQPDNNGNDIPQRLQSLHDNLLGNFNAVDMASRFSEPLLSELIALIRSVDPALLDRGVYSGDEGVTNNALAWDAAHGFAPLAAGKFAAVDVDQPAGTPLQWSATAGAYGRFVIDPNTGEWSYTLDHSRAATQALGLGETTTETITITVTDEFGATDTIQHVITVKGINDAPVISGGDLTGDAYDPGYNANHELVGTTSIAGQLEYSDADPDDTPANDHWSVTGSSNGSYGSFSIDQDGKWTYVLNPTKADVLGLGETVAEKFVVRLTDSHGAYTEQTITINVHGSAEGPIEVWDNGAFVNSYASIQAANDAATTLAGMTIRIVAATYRNETATLTKEGLSVEGAATNTGIVLTLGAGVADLTLLGASPFSVVGNDLANVITGNEAANVFTGKGGNDTFVGGDGDDTFHLVTQGFDNGLDHYDGGAGYDVIKGGWSTETLHVTSNLSNLVGIEEINGGSTPSHNIIKATSGDDVLDFSAATGKNIKLVDFVIDGGDGDDIIIGHETSINHIRGGAGNDTLKGGNLNDTFYLNTGGDTNGIDQYDGGEGYDRIVGDWSYDTLHVKNNLSNLVSIEEVDGGDTTPGRNKIVATGGDDTLDFSRIVVKNFHIESGAGNDTVHAATQTSGNIVYDGGAGNDTLVVTVTLAQMQNATLMNQLAALAANGGNGTVNAENLTFTSRNFERLEIQLRVGDTDIPVTGNIWIGTSNHDSGGPHTPALSVPVYKASQINDAWTILGLGGDDTIVGGNADDVLIGGIGRDTMDGGNGSDTYLVGPGESPGSLGDNYNDTGATGYDRIVATGDGTQIVINSLSGIEEINGAGFAGVNISGATGAHTTFDLADTKLVGINEVRGGGDTSNDTFHTSNDSDAIGGQAYRGGKGHDTFHLGSQSTRLFVSADDNGGFDSFNGNTFGDAAAHTLIVEGANANVGIGTNYGGSKTVDLIDASAATNASLVGSGDHNIWDLSTTVLKGISIVDVGGGNDTVRTAVNTDSHITYKGGTGNDTLVVSLTAAQAANAAVLSAIAALTPGSGINGSVNVGGVSFSAESFETIKLAIAVGNIFLEINPANILAGTSDHSSVAVANPALASVLFGYGGSDTLTGGDGDDILVGGTDRDTLDGKDGSDTYLVGPGDGPTSYGDNYNDTGSTGYDRIVATDDGTQIVIKSLSGIEEINGAGFAGVNISGATSEHTTFDLTDVKLVGINEVQGGGPTSGDTFHTSNVSDAIGGQAYRGGGGNDTFHFGSQDTRLFYSGQGNGLDSFNGNTNGAKHTIIVDGDDTEIGLARIYGGTQSVDEINANGHSGAKIVGSDSFHQDWDFSQTTLTGIESINGAGGNDRIIGSSGNDTINGGGGNDILVGGDGNDILWGGAGRDTLTGGAGADTFVFKEAGAANADTITDYVFGEDVIDLSELLSGVNAGNVGDFVQVVNSSAGALLQVDINGGSGGSNWVDVATFTGLTSSNDIDVLIDGTKFTI